jgi:flavin prenyltransferase
VLRQDDSVETHLILTDAAKITIAQETDWKISDVEALADEVHKAGNIGASIASGSFHTMGMAVVPCSIKSLSAIAFSHAGDLLTRAADVQLKEGRRLVLVVRESPLHLGHLRLMVQAAEVGAVILPPMPAFYSHPQSVDDMINGIVGRILLRLGIDNDLYFEWLGLRGRTS